MRRKLSEYRAKNIVNDLLDLKYVGWESLVGKVPAGLKKGKFVVKVDQAIKQRFKRGLVFLDVAKEDVAKKVEALNKKGFSFVIIEPFYVHDVSHERYIAFRREREGVLLSYSHLGGVEIESNVTSIKSGIFENFNITELAQETGLSREQLLKLRQGFDELYLSSLEINPYVVDGKGLKILDVAIEVDSAAEQLVEAWQDADVRTSATHLTSEVIAVRQLNNESPASFSLEMINNHGGIFLLLSGGGASIVAADEIFIKGHGKNLANFGEYSGNPTEHEAEYYAEQVIRLLMKSKANNKVVFIGGAVANFTDIKITFDGIIIALKRHGAELKKQGVKFFVRRGGPHQEEGLEAMQSLLEEYDILGGVYGPSTTIPNAIDHLVKAIKS